MKDDRSKARSVFEATHQRRIIFAVKRKLDKYEMFGTLTMKLLGFLPIFLCPQPRVSNYTIMSNAIAAKRETIPREIRKITVASMLRYLTLPYLTLTLP